MIYYVVKEKESSKFSIVEKEYANDGTYHKVKNKVFLVVGQWGNIKHAEHWRDYKNNLITEEEHDKWLFN